MVGLIAGHPDPGHCSNCGYEFSDVVADPGKRIACPECGGTSRTFQARITEHIALSDLIVPHLREYIDRSTESSAEATLTALSDIRGWYGESDEETRTHIYKKHIMPKKADVPVGPYDDEEVIDILQTFDEIEAQRSERRWQTADRLRPWIIPVVLAVIAAITAIVKFT